MAESMIKEEFTCNRDGMTIRGLVLRPEGENLPIAIVSHGFMANYRTTQGYAKWFAEHGYPALCIPDDARAGKMMLAKFDPENIPETFWCGPMKLGRGYAASVLNTDIIAEISIYAGKLRHCWKVRGLYSQRPEGCASRVYLCRHGKARRTWCERIWDAGRNRTKRNRPL